MQTKDFREKRQGKDWEWWIIFIIVRIGLAYRTPKKAAGFPVHRQPFKGAIWRASHEKNFPSKSSG